MGALRPYRRHRLAARGPRHASSHKRPIDSWSRCTTHAPTPTGRGGANSRAVPRRATTGAIRSDALCAADPATVVSDKHSGEPVVDRDRGLLPARTDHEQVRPSPERKVEPGAHPATGQYLLGQVLERSEPASATLRRHMISFDPRIVDLQALLVGSRPMRELARSLALKRTYGIDAVTACTNRCARRTRDTESFVATARSQLPVLPPAWVWRRWRKSSPSVTPRPPRGGE